MSIRAGADSAPASRQLYRINAAATKHATKLAPAEEPCMRLTKSSASGSRLWRSSYLEMS
jgi:hypothetical protein